MRRSVRSRLAVAVASVVLLGLHTPSASAEVGVVVVGSEGQAARAGLVEALRIQLLGTGRVDRGPILAEQALAAKLREATRVLEAGQASLVVWVEQASPAEGGPAEILLFVVGRRDARALVVVTPIPAGEAAEVDRALALKIRAVLDETLVEGPTARALVESDATPPARPAPSRPRPPEPPRLGADPSLSVAALVELGGVVWSGAGTVGPRPGAAAGGGLRVEHGLVAAEVVGTFRAATDFTLQGREGTLEGHELMVVGGPRVMVGDGGLGVGAHAAFGGRFLDVEGLSASGGAGAEHRVVPVLEVGPEVRADLAGWASIRLAGAVEVATLRQRFTINGEPIVDLGVVRGLLGLSLVVTAP